MDRSLRKENMVFNLVNLLRNREIKPEKRQALQKSQFTDSLVKRLDLQKELKGHVGCVNCLQWSADGRRLASGSDDTTVLIWDPFRHRLLKTLHTPHIGNIFSVKFLGSDESLVATGAGDCRVIVQSIDQTLGSISPQLDCSCHIGRVKRLVTSPEEPSIFWSAGEDGMVLQFDLREPHECHVKCTVLIDFSYTLELKCIALNPVNTYLFAVGANDSYIRLYDRRMIKVTEYKTCAITEARKKAPPEPQDPQCVQYFAPGHLARDFDDDQNYKVATTYLTFSPSGADLLVNMGGEHIYLYDINNPRYVKELGLPEVLLKEKSSVYNNCCSMIANGTKPVLKKRLHIYNNRIAAEPCVCDYLGRGRCLFHRKWTGDFYAAARDFLHVIKHWPDNTQAYLGLIDCLVSLNWKQEAHNWIEYFLKCHPEFTDNVQIKLALSEISQNDEKTPAEEMLERRIITEDERILRLGARDYELRFLGHCNTTTDIKEANFLGEDGNFVCAGSDDGIIFIWDRKSTNVVTALWGDGSIVNCIQPHPSTCLLATSGIDPFVKLWAPTGEEGIDNTRVVLDPWAAVEANQRRMALDPFETMLANLGYRIGSTDSEDIPHCRSS